jgi:adenylate cyclase
MAINDPIRNELTYWGRELTRAARIEPRTPEGEVYVTDAFAALLALEPESAFAAEYMGRVTTAKDFETIPMYRLRRVTI